MTLYIYIKWVPGFLKMLLPVRNDPSLPSRPTKTTSRMVLDSFGNVVSELHHSSGDNAVKVCMWFNFGGSNYIKKHLSL